MDKDKDRDSRKQGLLSQFGIGKRRSASTEEEIREYVAGVEELHENEKRMISDLLDLGNMAVREIMTPRVDMMSIKDTETVRQALGKMRGSGHSRLPVYHEDADNIIGLVHYKDLIAPLLDDKDDECITEHVYDCMFVPETKDVLPLLAEMQTNRQQMAIVVDEYGGTDGLITVEDILEEIVGEILDESDRVAPFISSDLEGVWTADGRYPVEDAIDLGWPLEDSDDYETLAGWLMSAFGSVPETGDDFETEGFRFKILGMRRHRITLVRVERLPEGAADQGQE